MQFREEHGVARQRPTIYRLALGQVGIVLAGEEAVSITADNAFDIAAQVGKHTILPLGERVTYPPFTLKNRPSMVDGDGLLKRSRWQSSLRDVARSSVSWSHCPSRGARSGWHYYVSRPRQPLTRHLAFYRSTPTSKFERVKKKSRAPTVRPQLRLPANFIRPPASRLILARCFLSSSSGQLRVVVAHNDAFYSYRDQCRLCPAEGQGQKAPQAR